MLVAIVVAGTVAIESRQGPLTARACARPTRGHTVPEVDFAAGRWNLCSVSTLRPGPTGDAGFAIRGTRFWPINS